jgi:hypothetical protein
MGLLKFAKRIYCSLSKKKKSIGEFTKLMVINKEFCFIFAQFSFKISGKNVFNRKRFVKKKKVESKKCKRVALLSCFSKI